VYDPGNGSILDAVTDMNYVPTGSPNDGIMKNRIVSAPNPIVGSFSPYSNFANPNQALNKASAEANPLIVQDVVGGGIITLRGWINTMRTRDKLLSFTEFTDLGITIMQVGKVNQIDLITDDIYQNYGESWGRGRQIWNLNDGTNNETIETSGGEVFEINFGNFNNRQKIIDIMA
jgi:hypothetical protein